MKRSPLAVSLLLLTGFLLLTHGALAASASAPSLRAPGGKALAPSTMQSLAEAKGFDLESAREKDCVIMTMSCNSTVTSVLDTTDCELDDGTRIDFWEFQGNAGETVTINLSSNDFDTFLFLLDPVPEVAAFNDDVDGTTNSRVVHTLGASGTWTAGANGFSATDLGNYTLSLECSGSGPTTPAAPTNLSASTLSTSEINLTWQDNSNNEDEFRVEIKTEGTEFQDIGAVAANATTVDVISLDPATTYSFRVRARNTAGNSEYSNEVSATTLSEGEGCTPTDTNMCLSGGRFKVEASWRDFEGNTGVGQVVPFGSDDSGLFWFFAADNWEMLVKVLDTCGSPFNSFWVFSAATTNVEYTLTVTDTVSGQVKEYVNPLGTAAPALTDTSAFETCP